MVLAILQARYSSSRLPGKVLSPILGQAMLARQIERLRHVRNIDQLLIATSHEASDDCIEALAQDLGVFCFRGSLNDVLDRFYQAAKLFQPDYVVRLTGDCPLAEPSLIDAVIEACLRAQADYAANTLTPTFPDGLDAEAMTFDALETAWREAALPSQREHVTPFIYQHPMRFKLASVTQARDLSDLRWTVDAAADLEFVRRIYERLYPSNPVFGMREILALLEAEPKLRQINLGFVRNEGYLKSLQKDPELPSIPCPQP
jgi:spore coat polysaccharide biosynthesis protein SpsF